jgi:hypothetical protein
MESRRRIFRGLQVGNLLAALSPLLEPQGEEDASKDDDKFHRLVTHVSLLVRVQPAQRQHKAP